MNAPAQSSRDRRHEVFGSLRSVAAAGAVVVGFGAAAIGALSGVSGATTGPTSVVGSGQVQLREGVGSTTCFSTGLGSKRGGPAGACNSINDLGAATDQTPGTAPTSTTVTVTNVGSVGTSVASLSGGTCRAAAAADNAGFTGSDLARFCNSIDLTIANRTPGAHYRCVFPAMTVDACPAPSRSGTLAELANRTLTGPGMSPLASGASATYAFTVRSDPSQTNADQGLTAALPLTWTISQ